ncbi:hypothetical protein GCK72_002481 [Caenorhabditis remanei]|uniref:Nucleotide-diphospho-sugar transferase domain-containing protein n=1 Tax=Caenorhabditis remanei TaxID=31234 RepID=A0A6A5HR18_CAERE|nr:hypothetical protein GCK72_002481 [Caenorhabditis remanei]KAF1770660.1 hypothetical protein GCK72_002481 [Caenorhabditis remanei]
METYKIVEEKAELPDQFSLSRSLQSKQLDITVLIIVNDSESAEREYDIALNSVRCYCEAKKYRLEIAEDTDFRHFCQQENSMFRRHCIVAHLLRESDYVFLLEPGMAVVNNDIRLEEFIDEKYDMTMYDKFTSWEIDTNSYVVKNTVWSRDFLMKLAEFETKIPSSSNDNTALHILLQKTFYPQFTEEAGNCLKILENLEFSTGNQQIMYTFEACIRSVIGEIHEFDNLRIIKKVGRQLGPTWIPVFQGTAWTREIWLTDSKWSQNRDFMLNGLKNAHQTTFAHGVLSNILLGRQTWRSPFINPPNQGECDFSKWEYDRSLITSKAEIDEYLMEKYDEVEKMRWQSLAAVGNYMSKD